MYAIIVGAGKVGIAITRWLLEADQEVTIIERDAERRAVAEDELGSIAVDGDATESLVLSRAGASRADALIATGRRDDENLVICQMAKNLFDVETVMATVNVSEHVELFQRLGVDVSIDIVTILAETFEESVGRLMAEDIGGLQ